MMSFSKPQSEPDGLDGMRTIRIRIVFSSNGGSSDSDLIHSISRPTGPKSFSTSRTVPRKVPLGARP